VVFLAGAGALMFAFAPQLIALFRDDPEVIACGAAALRFQCLTFPAQSWIVMSNMMEQSVDRTVPATFLSAARQGIFFIPALWILSSLLGLTGIQMAQSTADLCTLLCAIPIHLHVMRTIKK
jgi:Na+-driven multidrug efflux pump